MKRLAILLALAATPALGQQATPTDVQIQRNTFMSAFAQCDSASIDMQKQLAEANAKIKALEAAAAAQKPADAHPAK